jgi:pimeloyl-ACP methyl ester carboxylesterase
VATRHVANALKDTTAAQYVERIDCGEVVLDCIVAGHHDRPLVVLLHGFPESRHSWRHQIGPLSRHYRVVAPNLRGYGKSDRPHGVAAYRLERLAADVRGLVRALKRERAHIVGHDWGGAIAWALAIDDARSKSSNGKWSSPIEPVVDKLVVMNCPHPARFERALRFDPAQQLRSAYFGFFLLPLAPEMLLGAADFSMLRRLIEYGLGDRTIDDVFGRDFDERLAKTLGDDGLTAAINYYRAAMLHADALRARYGGHHKISRPTLLIWGKDDSALGVELTRDMDSYFDHGRFHLEVLPGVSHWVQQEAPMKVDELLLKFLRSGPR